MKFFKKNFIGKCPGHIYWRNPKILIIYIGLDFSAI